MIDIETLQQRIAPLFPGLMGIEVVDAAADRVVARMVVRPELCTSGNILHGGAVMAFADTLGAIGTVLNLPADSRTTTTDSSTKFLAAAPVGSTVTGECTAFHRGRTTMVWQTLRQDRIRQALCGGDADAAGAGASAGLSIAATNPLAALALVPARRAEHAAVALDVGAHAAGRAGLAGDQRRGGARLPRLRHRAAPARRRRRWHGPGRPAARAP